MTYHRHSARTALPNAGAGCRKFGGGSIKVRRPAWQRAPCSTPIFASTSARSGLQKYWRVLRSWGRRGGFVGRHLWRTNLWCSQKWQSATGLRTAQCTNLVLADTRDAGKYVTGVWLAAGKPRSPGRNDWRQRSLDCRSCEGAGSCTRHQQRA